MNDYIIYAIQIMIIVAAIQNNTEDAISKFQKYVDKDALFKHQADNAIQQILAVGVKYPNYSAIRSVILSKEFNEFVSRKYGLKYNKS